MNVTWEVHCSYWVRPSRRASNDQCPPGYELKSVPEGERWGSSAMTITDEAVRMKSFSLVWKRKDAFSDLQNGSTCCPSSLPMCDSRLHTWITGLFHQADLKFFRPIVKLPHMLLYEWPRKMSSWRGSLLHSELPAVHVKEDLWRYVGTSWAGLWQRTHHPAWVPMGEGVVGVAGAGGGIKLGFSRNLDSRGPQFLRESRVELQLLRERPFPKGLRCLKRRQGDCLFLLMCELPLEPVGHWLQAQECVYLAHGYIFLALSTMLSPWQAFSKYWINELSSQQLSTSLCSQVARPVWVYSHTPPPLDSVLVLGCSEVSSTLWPHGM